jgi:hypothetical protein
LSRRADIEIGGWARAEKVEFGQEPDDGHVEFSGTYEAETLHERENLPDRVEPGVAYRDVRVRWLTRVSVAEPAPDEPRSDAGRRNRGTPDPPR